MKKILSYSLFILLFGFVSACNDAEVIPTSDLTSNDVNGSNAKTSQNFLQKMHVGGTVGTAGIFDGKATITNLSYDATGGLLADGYIEGTVKNIAGHTIHVKQAFNDVEATLADAANATSNKVTAQATCQILFLDLGPIFLDVLGLQVDLSQIVLDISAISGAGNLLGNLLCAVTGLLDPGTGLLSLLTNLTALLGILQDLNDLLNL